MLPGPPPASQLPEGFPRDGLWLELANAGGRHLILRDLNLRLHYGEDRAVSLGPEDLPGLSDTNLLAGARRYYRIDRGVVETRGLTHVTHTVTQE